MHTIRPQTIVLVHFIMFGCIWYGFVTALNSMQNRPNWCNYCKSSCHDVALEFFTTNTPDPHQWTLNSCFGAFRNVWVHLGPFCYYTKLGPKWSELVRIIANVHAMNWRRKFLLRTHPIHPLDPKVMFCETNCCCNFSNRMHPIQPIGP